MAEKLREAAAMVAGGDGWEMRVARGVAEMRAAARRQRLADVAMGRDDIVCVWL